MSKKQIRNKVMLRNQLKQTALLTSRRVKQGPYTELSSKDKYWAHMAFYWSSVQKLKPQMCVENCEARQSQESKLKKIRLIERSL